MGRRDACASNNDVFRCSAPYTAWRSMPVLTPAQGRSGRAGGLAGAREEAEGGASRSRERERQGGRAEGTGAEWKKMNKHPARDGGGELPRSAPVRTLSLLSPFFSRALSSLSLFPLLFLFSLSTPLLSLTLCPSFFLDCPSVSLYDAPLAATAGFLLPERFPLNVKTRSSAAGSLLSLPFPASLSLRDLFRERACL